MVERSHPQQAGNDIAEALESCAAEPVHMPGKVQPFACLVCVNASSGLIDSVSANSSEIVGHDPETLMGREFHDVFGQEISHAVNNAAGTSSFREKSKLLGLFDFDGKSVEVSGSMLGGNYLLQFEPPKDPELGGGDTLNALSFLMREIQACKSQSELFNHATELLRQLTGYDRVMIYRFDPMFNGEVVAEARQRTMEPFLGLCFPQWDIPKQARAIMAQIPLRFIEDVDQQPVSLLAPDTAAPALDITLAECRGVSTVHMEYLRNMGVKATMTLTIKVDDGLWGMISFHHRRPRIPAAKIRELLGTFSEIFCTKLTILQQQEQLRLVQKIDALKDETLGSIEQADAKRELAAAGPAILEATQSDGLAVMSGSAVKRHGQIVDQAALDYFAKLAHAADDEQVAIANINEIHPEIASGCNGLAGVLAIPDGPGRTLFLFRGEIATTVNWAGNPEKTIEDLSGTKRLRPRASFSVFLEEVKGKSKSWTEDDIGIAKRVWKLIDSAERRELGNRLKTQQDLMINELNHRVRNILSLVRSVSRQARIHNSSLESYSNAIERRIQALAAAHDVAAGSTLTAISIRELIDVELEPYNEKGNVSLTGDGLSLRSDIAPIFALVIHELATNAAKYGALSVSEGTVAVQLSKTETGVLVTWREAGGPEVVAPNRRGFGSTLIEQAVPFEMGGSADLRFEPTGVEADIGLPFEVLEFEERPKTGNSFVRVTRLMEPQVATWNPAALDGLVLIVEDNYMIAKDTRDQLADLGIKDIEICGNVSDALAIVDDTAPAFAVLDLNLGPDKTSTPIARRLLELNVPFVFATGYSDKFELAPEFAHVEILTKPVPTNELLQSMARVFSEAES